MTASARLGATTRRLASVVSIIRTRGEDEQRFARHAGVNGDIERRVERAVERIEAATAELEKAIA